MVLTALLIGLVAPAVHSSPSNVLRPLGSGEVDWTSGKLKVTGSGAPPERGSAAQKRLMTRRAAVADGYRQLAEIVAGVQVSSETTVKNFVTESDVIRTKVSAVIKGAKPVAERFLSDGAMEVDMEMPFYGSDSLAWATDLGSFVLNKMDDPYPTKISMYGPLFWISEKPWLFAAADDVTGVVVDASGLGAEPAMVPFVVGGAQRVYTGNKINIDPAQVVSDGVTHYVDDLDKALKDPRVGNKPFVVEAKGITGKPATDILIDTGDSAKLLEINQRFHVLDKLRVTLVI